MHILVQIGAEILETLNSKKKKKKYRNDSMESLREWN